MASFEIELNSDNAQKSASSLTDQMSGLTQAMGGADGASTGLTSSFGGLAESLGPIGIAVAVAVAAITALVATLWAGVQAAIGINQQRDALVDTFDALGDGAGAGQKTIAMLQKLGQVLPFSQKKLQDWAKSLMAAGLQGPKLEKGIKAVAAATAIMGEAGGTAAQTLIKKFAELGAAGGQVKIDKGLLKQLAAAGISAETLAKQLGVAPEKLAGMSVAAAKMGEAIQDALIAKGKGPLEDLALTWSSISSKLSDGFSSLFKDLGPEVKELMAAVKSLFAEFFEGSATTKNAKGVVTSVLHEVLVAAKQVVNGIHIGFLMLEVAFLKAKNALKPLTDKLKEILPAGTGASILVGIVKGLAVVFAILAVAVFIALLPLMLLAAVAVLVGFAIYEVISAIADVGEWLMGLGADAGTAAKGLIDGLVNGIRSGAGLVIDAVKGLASSILSTLTGGLATHSPSTITTKMGHVGVAGGLALGMEKGQDGVERAAKGLAGGTIGAVSDGLDGASGAAGKSAKSKGAGGGGITINEINLTIHGATGDAADMTVEAVTLVFEKIALQQGLAAA